MRLDRNYYGTLGVGPAAEPEEIRQRYRELARRYHPDVARDPARAHREFLAIAEAYEVLSDPRWRREYDLHSRFGRVQAGVPETLRPEGPSPGEKPSSTGKRSAASPCPEAPSAKRAQGTDRSPLVGRLAVALGWAVVGWLLYLSLRAEGPRLEGFWPLSHVPVRALGLYLAACFLSGLLLAGGGLLRRYDDELLFAAGGPLAPRGSAPPLGLLLPLLALLNLYLALAAHLVSAALLERPAGSVLRSFAAVALLSVLFALPHAETLRQMVLWASGYGFASFCLGWLLADAFRPHW